MSITPIEIATMAPKSQEAVIAKNVELQKPSTDQMNASVQMANKVQQNSDEIIRLQKSDTPEFRYDAKEKGSNSYGYHGQSKKQEKGKNNPDKKTGKEGKTKRNPFDVRI